MTPSDDAPFSPAPVAHNRYRVLSPALREWLAMDVLPHEPKVRRWLRSAGATSVEIDDIIQEAYRRLACTQDAVFVRSGAAYFLTTARNILREQQRRRRVVRFEGLPRGGDLDVTDETPSAERALAARQELEHVRRLLRKLPDRCREVLLLRRVQGLSQREVARALGVTENVVEKQLARGIRLLLDLIASETRSGGEDG